MPETENVVPISSSRTSILSEAAWTSYRVCSDWQEPLAVPASLSMPRVHSNAIADERDSDQPFSPLAETSIPEGQG